MVLNQRGDNDDDDDDDDDDDGDDDDDDDDDDQGDDEDFEKAGLGSSGGVKSKLISRLNFG